MVHIMNFTYVVGPCISKVNDSKINCEKHTKQPSGIWETHDCLLADFVTMRKTQDNGNLFN